MHLLVALLLAADSSSGLVAVLELRNKLKGAEREQVDAGYFTDRIRAGLREKAPQLKVITRENAEVMLAAQGKKLEECEGLCEVDTGRLLNADFVVSGELLKVGSALKMNLRLHETAGASLLTGALASGKSVDELDADAAKAIDKLVEALPKPRGTPRLELTVATEAMGDFIVPIALKVSLDESVMYNRVSDAPFMEKDGEIPVFSGDLNSGDHQIEATMVVRHRTDDQWRAQGTARATIHATPGARLTRRVVWFLDKSGLTSRVE
jgi:hypothetical protein